MFTVNILFRHIKAANIYSGYGKRLQRCLQDSKGLKHTYTKCVSCDLAGENDADWSGDRDDRKSTTGYYFKHKSSRAALSWRVKKQVRVVFFPPETDYQGMPKAVQEAFVWNNFWRILASNKNIQ